jgi:hypothetical protein
MFVSVVPVLLLLALIAAAEILATSVVGLCILLVRSVFLIIHLMPVPMLAVIVLLIPAVVVTVSRVRSSAI